MALLSLQPVNSCLYVWLRYVSDADEQRLYSNRYERMCQVRN